MCAETWPFITVVVPVLNEGRYLLDCLASLAAQDYPPALWEGLIVDGGSNDDTTEIAQVWAARDGRFRLLPNPRRIAASALNIGLKAGRGEVFVRVDGHSILAPDYLTCSVLSLQGEENVAGVGGGFQGVGDTPLAQSVAAAMASRFGAGDARYRFPRQMQKGDADTVYLGAYPRRWLEAVSGYNESLAANEDYELNVRLRQAGGRIVLDPAMASQTWVRSNLASLARQYASYGFWKGQMLRQHPGSLRWRQVAAPSLVAALLLTGIGSLFWSSLVVPLLAIAGLYLLATGTATIHLCRQHGWRHLWRLPLIFCTMHLTWGVAFWPGLLWPRRAAAPVALALLLAAAWLPSVRGPL